MPTFRVLEAAFPDGTNMNLISFQGILLYDFYDANPTVLRFFDDAADATTFTGRGLTYSFQNGILSGVTGGRLNGLTERDDGQDTIVIRGLDVSARSVAEAILGGRDADALRLLTAGHDDILGTDSDDLLTGNAGNDTLRGDAGNDRLFGGAGNDRLQGSTGADTMSGGSGADDFVFGTGPRSGVDRINDFARTVDDILLENGVFTGLGAIGALGGRYAEGTRATQDNDRIIYTQSTGEIFFDRDGVGGATKVLFARVTAGTDLSAGDFLVI